MNNDKINLNLNIVTLCAVLFTPFANSYGLQIRELDPYQKANIVISNHEFNRITVENDRIINIFAMKDKFHIETDEQNGQIFLGVKDKSFGSGSISIVTEKGTTQDLQIAAKDIAAETIIFKDITHPQKKSASMQVGSSNYPTSIHSKSAHNHNVRNFNDIPNLHSENEHMTVLIKAMMQQQSLNGYNIRIIHEALDTQDSDEQIILEKVQNRKTEGKGRDGKKENKENENKAPKIGIINKTHITSYEGDSLVGEIYQITNNTNQNQILQEQDFNQSSKVKMILLEKFDLTPSEVTYLYVVRYV